MRVLRAVFRKEFSSYFSSPIAYVFLIVFLVLTSFLFFLNFFLRGQASLAGYFANLPIVFCIFCPVLTMRLLAEERKLGTDEVLLTLPVKGHQVILGKYAAALALLALSLVLTFPLYLTVMWLGDPDLGATLCGYLGAFLLGAGYLSIGLFASGLTENQIVAFIIGLILCFGLLVIGADWMLIRLPGTMSSFFRALGLGTHFNSIARGVIDSRDLVYYLSVIFFFLFMTTAALEHRKWK